MHYVHFNANTTKSCQEMKCKLHNMNANHNFDLNLWGENQQSGNTTKKTVSYLEAYIHSKYPWGRQKEPNN